MLSKTSPTSESIDMLWNITLAAIVLGAFIFLPESASAAGIADEEGGKIGDALCRLIKWMTGKTGKAIATLGIIIIGVGALMGKVSWGMAIIVALGIALIFGAGTLVNVLGAGGDLECS